MGALKYLAELELDYNFINFVMNQNNIFSLNSIKNGEISHVLNT